MPSRGHVDILINSAGIAPAGRAASAEEITAAITYPAADDASYVNGAVSP